MKRAGIATFAFVSLLLSAGAYAAPITQSGVFFTQDQGLFQPGPATAFHFDFQTGCPACFSFTSASWGAKTGAISGPSILPTAPGSWEIAGSLNQGFVGLNPVLDTNGGSVKVNYPVQLIYNVPQGPVSAGSKVTIGTSYVPEGQPLLQTAGENLKASLNLVANISGNISDTYFPLSGPLGFIVNSFGCAQPACVIFDLPFNINLNLELISVGSGSTSASFSPAGIGSGLSLNAPSQLNLSTNQLDANGKLSVDGSANPPIIAGELELLDALIFAGVPPGVLNGSFPAFGSSYSVLSAKLSGGLALYESFTFGVDNLPITLTANTGEVHTGFMGESFDFGVGNEPLVIDAAVDIANTFKAIEGLGLGATFSWAVLKANAAGFQLGPLAGDSYNLASVSCEVFGTCWKNTSFPLGGFNTLTNQFVIAVLPEPGTLLLMLIGILCAIALRARARPLLAMLASTRLPRPDRVSL
jgi:hypothetical protein